MERPKVGTGVLILKDNKVLFGQRTSPLGKGTWCPPGGHLEFFETFEECVKREAFEETGVEIDNVKFFTVTNDIFKEENKHYVTIIFTASLKSGIPELKEPDKWVEWKWFSWDDLPSPLFLPIENLKRKGYDPFEKR